jgi:alkylation response protein AidB-like acyl-CoA dehydrogenase
MNFVTPIFQVGSSSVLTRIREILPEIIARADEIETSARVPMDLLDKIEAAGAFRICLPASFGGEQLTYSEASRVIEEIAADALVAGHLMVAAGSQVITSRLPGESLREYHANGPDTWPEAAAAPKGVAVPVEGGYRLSGRWPLASGARRFEWINLGFFIKDENGLRKGPNGAPDFGVCLIPRGMSKLSKPGTRSACAASAAMILKSSTCSCRKPGRRRRSVRPI